MSMNLRPYRVVALVAFITSPAFAASFPFVETGFDDPDWVVASSRMILTDGSSVPDWFDNPEAPAWPERHHYWKFEEDKEDGRAVPMVATFGSGLNGFYVREGFDVHFYADAELDQPYPGPDACGMPHPVLMESPYYATPCEWQDDPENPAPNNFSARTFFVMAPGNEMGSEGVVVNRRRLIILDIDGCRRDALYGLLGNDAETIPTLAGIVMGRSTRTGRLLGRVVSQCVFVEPEDRIAEGTTDFSTSFQSVGLNTAYTVLPSYTFSCQASLFTGFAPGEHGILGNEWFNRFGKDFEDAHHFRRGYSGGSARSVNQITRNYEWGAVGIKDDGFLCRTSLVDISGSPGAFGHGGLVSTDLQVKTIYEQLSERHSLNSLIAFNMILSSRNYHNDANISYVQPTDDDLCTYNEDDTGRKYDRRMVTMLLAELNRLHRGKNPFPDVVTVYFSGHDHHMHKLGNNQTAYLKGLVDPELKRFLTRISDWVDVSNLMFAISTDHGHTAVKKDARHSIVVKGELAATLARGPANRDVYDGIFEEEFDAYVALNGGMAHVHLRREGGTWIQMPSTRELLNAAKVLYHHGSRSGGGKIEFIIGKDLDTGDWRAPYQAYDPAREKFVDLGDYLAAHPELAYVDFERRVNAMNRARAGDLVCVANVRNGYYFDVEQASGHGSPYGTDSLIPMIFSGRGLQRVANGARTIALGDQIDFAPTAAGLLGAPIATDGKDHISPLLR